MGARPLTSGGKWFRLKYRYGGREKHLSLGIYPDVSLKEARNRRDEMRKLLADGIDPGEQCKAMKAAQSNRDGNSFEVVAREWFAKNEQVWSTAHSSKIIRRLERDIFPWLGRRPVSEINPPELLKVLQKIENRGAVETAHRAMQNCGQVFRFAVATGTIFHISRLFLSALGPPMGRPVRPSVSRPLGEAGVIEVSPVDFTISPSDTIRCRRAG